MSQLRRLKSLLLAGNWAGIGQVLGNFLLLSSPPGYSAWGAGFLAS